ncbi:MAG: AAA family ATPase [Candidatus Nealsonbacteria bacterium]|nr:AAA family ATPase [Candidatus Nealsonbacteria bacterium]
MKTITFFSYKGGVGRTLAATNFAVYLAKLGLNVVIMDFDLDAPGVDSKFPGFRLPEGQLGLLDYILRFQQEGSAPGPVDEILCRVPVSSSRQDCTVGLIPAGDYLAADYCAKLNELNWADVFSDERGVEFFQLFLERIKEELSLDVLVIDSRTGFSEIGGLCTQQLADEAVILSSLASESVKMTRHLAKIIRESEIARKLNKPVETKIVVSRVPKPRRGIDKLKAECCKKFDVDETKLFFLFSCPGLEREEFVAMLDTQKEESLIASYMQLFQGLDVEVAQESIREEIERTEKGLLSCSANEAEVRIREMVALFPHPEVYRRAMRFFELTRRPDEASIFGLRLLELLPDNKEAQLQVARFVLHSDINVRHGALGRQYGQLFEKVDIRHLVAIAERAYATGDLLVEEKVRLADLLEDLKEHAKSFQIAKDCLEFDEFGDPDVRSTAMGIAARTAMKLGKKEEAAKLVASIPLGRLRGTLANVAVQLKVDAGDKDEAFELSKAILSRGFTPGIIGTAAELARELQRQNELEEVIHLNPELESGILRNSESMWELEQHGFDVSGFHEQARAARRVARRRH